jgi:hypothetical protein
VRPGAAGSFSASVWYSSFNGSASVGSLFSQDCSRTPETVLVFLLAGDQTLATARLEIPGQFTIDALGNYRAKSRVTLRGDGHPGPR